MKIVYKFLFLCLLTWQQAFALEKLISLKEVQSHNSVNDCWIIVEKKIYDITKLIKTHDSKCEDMKLTNFCGKDASTTWTEKQKSGHAHKRKSVLNFERSQIGMLP